MAAGGAGEAGGIGGLKAGIREGGHHFVFELAEVGAELGFEVGPAIRRPSPTSFFVFKRRSTAP